MRTRHIVDGRTVFDDGDPDRPEYDPTIDQREAQRQAVHEAWARMTQIAEFAGTATIAQASAALKDLARYVKVLARLHEDDLLGG